MEGCPSRVPETVIVCSVPSATVTDAEEGKVVLSNSSLCVTYVELAPVSRIAVVLGNVPESYGQAL